MPRFTGGPVHNVALTKLWRQRELCDIQVTVDAQQFDAHRCVLAVGSDFMAACFRASTSDSSHRLEIKEMTAAAFSAALEYVYTGCCEVDNCDIVDVLEAAVRLQIPNLQQQAENAVTANLTPQNASSILLIAERFSLPRVSIMAEYGVQLSTGVFDKLPPALCVVGGYDDDALFCRTRSKRNECECLAELNSDGGKPVEAWVMDPSDCLSGLPIGNDNVAVIEVGRQLYLFGKTVKCFDPLSEITREVCGFPHQQPSKYGGRYGVAELDGRIYVAGPGRRVVCLDLSTEQWLECPSMNYPREAPAMLAVGGKLYVLGGSSGNDEWDDHNAGGVLLSMEIFEPDPQATLRPVAAPEPIAKWARLDLHGRLIPPVGSCMADDELAPKGRWLLRPMPKARCGMAAAAAGDLIVVAGGRIEQFFYGAVEAARQVHCYDPKDETWRTLPPMNTGREQPALVFYKKQLYVIGGSAKRDRHSFLPRRDPGFVDLRACDSDCCHKEECEKLRKQYPNLQPLACTALNTIERIGFQAPFQFDSAWQIGPSMNGHRGCWPLSFMWKHCPSNAYGLADVPKPTISGSYRD